VNKDYHQKSFSSSKMWVALIRAGCCC